jgi:multiple sugar transport system ATP-binding protein
VTLGVRPQHLRLGHANGSEQIGFGGALMVSEQLGDEQLLAVRVSGTDIRVAGVDPELALGTATRVDVSVPVESLHIFDGASSAAIR